MKKFRICYTAQDGSKTIIYNKDRFVIDLNGQVYENYGADWRHPMWDIPFDTAAPPILQQSTGCEDCDGKEIYEGDIVSFRGQRGVIEFFAGSFKSNWGDQTDDDIGYLMTADLKVTGNNFGV